MKRISRDELAISIARLFAKRGTCGRRQVGCCLTIDGRVIASGYNGTLPGSHHCSLLEPKSERTCDPTLHCTDAVHAEANMIAYCAKHGIATKDSILYTTSFPCKKCAELVIQAGIITVYYDRGYHKELDDEVKQMFLNAKVDFHEI